jgi:hypothetical protein
LFVPFARRIAGLTHRQAEVMFWKDWFWMVRAALIRFDNEAEQNTGGAVVRQTSRRPSGRVLEPGRKP